MTQLFVGNLCVRYPNSPAQALDDVSLLVDAGDRIGVIGESGSGKSTFALAIAGILPEGTEITGNISWPELHRKPLPGRDIGFVFQAPSASLDPVMTVGEQVAEVARAHLGLSWAEARARAIALFERVRLPEPQSLAGAFPHQLSGGQKQRVAIAAAIAAEPSVLIADEATSALDTVVQAEIVRLLDDLTRDTRMTLIFISHDIALASQLVDRIAVFRAARLIEVGAAEQVLSRPADPYTRRLIEAHRVDA